VLLIRSKKRVGSVAYCVFVFCETIRLSNKTWHFEIDEKLPDRIMTASLQRTPLLSSTLVAALARFFFWAAFA